MPSVARVPSIPGRYHIFACLSTGGINPKDKKKGIISIGFRDRYADLPLQNLHVLSVADKTCRFQISSLVCWRGSPDFDIG